LIAVRAMKAIIGSFGFVLLAVVIAFGSQGTSVVAHGDGIEVTSAEVKAMRQFAKGAFKPSSKALVDGAVKNVLFAHEALQQDLACPRADEAEGFVRTVLLAKCYLDARLKTAGLRDGAVESYYRANWRDFVDKQTGKLLELDADMRQRIEERILAVKRKAFATREFGKLCKKYHVIFAVNGS